VEVRIVPGTGTRAPRPTPDVAGPVSITPVVSEAGGFVLRQARPLVIVDDVTVIDGRLWLAFTAADQVTGARFGSSAALLPVDGAWTVATPTLADLGAYTPLEATVGEHNLRPLARAEVGRRLPRGVARASRGTLHAIPGPRLLLTEVRTTDSMIELELAEAGLADVPAGSRWVAVRHEPGGEVGLEITASSPHVVRFDVPHSEVEDGDVTPGVTSVRLQLVKPGGPPVSLRIHERVLDAQPYLAPTHAYDVRVLVRADALELRIEHLMIRRARDATTGR